MTRAVEKRSPLKQQPSRFPGESARERWDEDVQEWAFGVVMIPFVLGMASFLAWVQYFHPGLLAPVLLSVAFVLSVPIARGRFVRGRKKHASTKLGWQGERAVGDALKELERIGYRVFHDLQFDGFNVDHVLVGPGGVFAVETKTASKRDKHGGTAKITWRNGELRIDGAIAMGDPIGQATSEAAEIGKLLRSAGQDIWVRAVLLYPGWWVEDDKPETPNQVYVTNEKYFVGVITDHERILSDEQVQAAAVILDARNRC